MSSAIGGDSQMQDSNMTDQERAVKESPHSSSEGFGEGNGNNSATNVSILAVNA